MKFENQNLLVSVAEHVADELYSQKNRARVFNTYLNKLWESLGELNRERQKELFVDFSPERAQEIQQMLKSGKFNVHNVTPSENCILLDFMVPELKQEVYSDTSLPQKTEEFYKRKKREMIGFSKIIDTISGDEIIDIAGGAGDMARVLSEKTGKPAKVLDINPHQLRYVEELNKILDQSVEPVQFDIRKDKIPDGTWVAKHPCGDLADHIIDSWSKSEGSPELYLMTCCQGMAKNHANPYGIDKEEWKQLCRQSDLTNSNDLEKRKKGQEAMEKLDSARIKYLQDKGFKAELRKVPDTIKGNVIVVKK